MRKLAVLVLTLLILMPKPVQTQEEFSPEEHFPALASGNYFNYTVMSGSHTLHGLSTSLQRMECYIVLNVTDEYAVVKRIEYYYVNNTYAWNVSVINKWYFFEGNETYRKRLYWFDIFYDVYNITETVQKMIEEMFPESFTITVEDAEYNYGGMLMDAINVTAVTKGNETTGYREYHSYIISKEYGVVLEKTDIFYEYGYAGCGDAVKRKMVLVDTNAFGGEEEEPETEQPEEEIEIITPEKADWLAENFYLVIIAIAIAIIIVPLVLKRGFSR